MKDRSLGWGFTKNLDKHVPAKSAPKLHGADADDKVTTLKQFRRKNGLCFKCGSKWAPTHTCPEQVPIHVLEELWDALEIQTTDDMEEVQSEIISAEDAIMAVQDPQLKEVDLGDRL